MCLRADRLQRRGAACANFPGQQRCGCFRSSKCDIARAVGDLARLRCCLWDNLVECRLDYSLTLNCSIHSGKPECALAAAAIDEFKLASESLLR